MLTDPSQACQIGGDTLQCGPGKAYTLELFNNANKADIQSLGFFKLTREMLQCMTNNKIQVHF
jgi:hypothetical protein